MIAVLSTARPIATLSTVLMLASPTSGSALWYLNRGTGIVLLVLFTIVVVLGVLTRRGDRPGGTPVFVLATLHRNTSLLATALLAVHITTAILDSYAPIRLVDALMPFVSQYRALWLGLGTLALDLLVALVVTSLVRVRIGLRRWRAVHWLAYAAWPVAVLHGLGTGTDTPSSWALLITAGCVLAVVVSVVLRARMIHDRLPQLSSLATGAAVFGPFALVAWLVLGPLAPGWAARSGTPANAVTGVDTPAGPSAPAGSSGPSGSSAQRSTQAAPRGTAVWSGQVSQRDAGAGQVEIRLSGPLSGGPGGRLEIRLVGAPADDGVALSAGTATLTADGGEGWTGPVRELAGNRIRAVLTDGATGRATVSLGVTVQVDQASSALSGTAAFS
jgi:sulfoxide reductase heme-binding subunit YedZ